MWDSDDRLARLDLIAYLGILVVLTPIIHKVFGIPLFTLFIVLLVGIAFLILSYIFRGNKECVKNGE